jgi:hypothetical protein
VDDFFLIFDSDHTNILGTLNGFNSLHPKLQFTAKNRKRPHPELPRRIYTQNPLKHENSHIQKTHIHTHHKYTTDLTPTTCSRKINRS